MERGGCNQRKAAQRIDVQHSVLAEFMVSPCAGQSPIYTFMGLVSCVVQVSFSLTSDQLEFHFRFNRISMGDMFSLT